MKLRIESVDIKTVKTGTKTYVSDHILFFNPKELEKVILRDERIESVELKVVNPGEHVRIVNVVDVIQPRCKVGRENEDFPGYLGKIAVAGTGTTRSLRNISVVLSNRYSKRPYSSIIDLFGIGAKMSKYGCMKHISVDPVPAGNTDEREFESAVKLAGLKTAVYLAKAADDHSTDETEVYDLDITNLAHDKKSYLPKIAYYYQLHTPQHDYQGIGDPILYGTEVTDLLPTVIHPNEILDGAVVNTHTIRAMDTYSIQNHPVIKDLYKRHGKELIFAGVVVGVASIEPIQRERMSMMAANLISNTLCAEGVILTKVHGGMPHVDLAFTADACERAGVKTVIFVNSWSSEGTFADQALFSSEFIDGVINIGNTFEKIRLPQTERILGGTIETPIFNPAFSQKAGDGSVEIEGFLLAGVYDHIGGAPIISIEC